MNAVWVVIFAIFTVWGILALMVTIADWMVKRSYEISLETRAWEEKVEAMRRMVDEDGAA